MGQVAAVSSEQLTLFDVGEDMAVLREERRSLLSFRRATGTQEAYASDFRIFGKWCASAGRATMPASADTVALFLTSQLKEGLKISTVERRLASIIAIHKHHNQPPPATPESRQLLLGARRKRHEKKEGKKALQVSELVTISRKLPNTPSGIRDRAILVFGFASGLRRSELARLDVGDIAVSAKGIAVRSRGLRLTRRVRGGPLGSTRASGPRPTPYALSWRGSISAARRRGRYSRGCTARWSP